jgi:hypothetical protein
MPEHKISDTPYANDADALDRTIVPHAEYDKLCRRYRKEAE